MKIQQFQERFFQAITTGDSVGAGDLMEELVRAGVPPRQIYVDVIAGAHRRVRPEAFSICEEHRATEIALACLGRLLQLLSPTPSNDRSVVVCCPAGEQHAVGARIIADLLAVDGWHVDFLGANTPTGDLLEYLQRSQCHLLCISISTETAIPVLRDLADKLQELPEKPPLLLGGAATLDERIFAELEPIGPVATADGILDKARQLVGLPSGLPSLEQYLLEIGKRVREIRRAKKLFQSELAQLAGLDRGHISAIENGKQNVTVSVLVRLAGALGVPVRSLLTGPEM